ncbi:MAG: hypothetical protein AB9915_01435 [Candidatus Dojkabacteria bacterium]
MADPKDPNLSEAPLHYSLEDGTTDTEKFLIDIFRLKNDTKEGPERIFSTIKDDLTKIGVVEKDKLEEKKISPSNTFDDTVVLMQRKLYALSPGTEEQELKEFTHERSLTIATFRMLNRLPSLWDGVIKNMNIEDLKKDLMFKIDGLVCSTETEKYWREPVYDTTGAVIYKSRDAMDRANGYRSNPDGKVSREELNSIVLPRVVNILRNMALTA